MNAPVKDDLRIDVETFDRLRRAEPNVTVLDVREPWEREICAIEPCLPIPLASLPEHLDSLPRDGILIVLCHHGVRSLQATLWLRRQGIATAVNLDGGIDAWADRVDGTMTRY